MLLAGSQMTKGAAMASHLVRAGRMVLAFPNPPGAVQCAALARQTGRRCRNPVEPRPTCCLVTLGDGRVAYDADEPPEPLRPIDADPAVRFLEQRCYVHLRHAMPDAVAHEWDAADLDAEVADLLGE